MFETFSIPEFYLEADAVCALYSSGRTSGLVVDFGTSQTNFVPIYSGHALRDISLSQNIGGSDVTKYLAQLLNEDGHENFLQAILLDIKKKHCFVSTDYEEQIIDPNFTEKSYELPDGQIIQIGTAQFQAPEIYFQPELIEKETLSTDQMVVKTIENCDRSLRKNMMKNILLVGGSTFSGMEERLKLELESMWNNEFKIHTSQSPSTAAWTGASIITVMMGKKSYISKEGKPRILIYL